MHTVHYNTFSITHFGEPQTPELQGCDCYRQSDYEMNTQGCLYYGFKCASNSTFNR